MVMDDIKDMINDAMGKQETPSDATDAGQTQIDQLVTCASERDMWKDRYMRVQADLDNFTKRVDKERVQWKIFAQSAVIQDILPIIDDFDRAFEQPVKDATPEMQTMLAGFDMIRKSFYRFLDKHEIKEIPASMPFDPQYHESLMHVDSPDHASGDIVAILQKGFTFKGTVLRPAKVSVAK
ncbi:MAG: nucleotide exchange factor GrpE [Candidatus Dependentiae bacterium]|nr:nucleotide exchange factor GrpE [Candidatus Dependentiae bacterium]